MKYLALCLLLAASSVSAQSTGLYAQRALFNLMCSKSASAIFKTLEEQAKERIAYHAALQQNENIKFTMWITENKQNKTISVIVTRETPTDTETCLVWTGTEIVPVSNPVVSGSDA